MFTVSRAWLKTTTKISLSLALFFTAIYLSLELVNAIPLFICFVLYFAMLVLEVKKKSLQKKLSPVRPIILSACKVQAEETSKRDNPKEISNTKHWYFDKQQIKHKVRSILGKENDSSCNCTQTHKCNEKCNHATPPKV